MSPRAEHPDNARSIARNLRNLPVVAPLRSKHIYNNMMYTVLTHLVEVKTQHTFSDTLKNSFFEPLRMTSSVLQPARARGEGMADRFAMGYHWDKDEKSLRPVPMVDMPEGQGAGSIISSVNDMILWVKALMNRKGPVTDRLYQELTRLRSIPDGRLKKSKPYRSPSFYAAGLEVYWYRGFTVIGHDGGIPGFGSRFFFLPEAKFGAVLMGNSGEAAQVIGTLVKWLIDSALGIPLPEIRTGKQHGTKPQAEVKDKLEIRMAASDLDDDDDSSSDEEQPSRPTSSRVAHTSLERYTGMYHNAGYHTLVVAIANNKLFIDATDRSYGYTLTFEQKRDETEFTAHLCDMMEGGDEEIDARYVFDGTDVAKLGLKLDWSSKGFIWFDRVEEEPWMATSTKLHGKW
jgi:hypothetical protein